MYTHFFIEMLETMILTKEQCICPNEGYVCEVNFATEINWITNGPSPPNLDFSLFNDDDPNFKETENFKAYFEGVRANDDFDNYTSTLFVVDILQANRTNLICEGAIYDRRTLVQSKNDTIHICLVGKIIQL